jgi:hypothetical protein
VGLIVSANFFALPANLLRVTLPLSGANNIPNSAPTAAPARAMVKKVLVLFFVSIVFNFKMNRLKIS